MSRPTTSTDVSEEIEYPTTDGKPMAETDIHRDNMAELIEILKARYARDPNVYVSGNLLLFYERGNKQRHISPDVFVVKDIPKRRRLHYLLWKEGKGPDFVIELTSKSTRQEDQKKKFAKYRDTLKVQEYFMFDPTGEYLDPPLKGYRLVRGKYVEIEFENDRLPSSVLQLHLERVGEELRLYDPESRRWLENSEEVREDRELARKELRNETRARRKAEKEKQQESEARQQAERERRQEAEARRQEAEALQRAERERQQEAEARHQAEQEIARLRKELEAARRNQST